MIVPDLFVGNCLRIMPEMPDASVDAIVTDPPYGLGFMGKEWDDLPPGREWAEECLRVLKPGGHMLAFGGTRTWHRLAVAVEDAGFEIRDSMAWLYGSGFPKSLDVSKAIDKAAGAERPVLSTIPDRWAGKGDVLQRATQAPAESVDITAPATPDAERWQGWGTALKPAFEPVVVARKPLTGTVAANVLAHGTGALNIDGCRVEHDAASAAWVEKWSGHELDKEYEGWGNKGRKFGGSPAGRWPANVMLDESQAAALDEQSGVTTSPKSVTRGASKPGKEGTTARSGGAMVRRENVPCHGDTGGASRFFYVAKAPKKERPVVEGSPAHPTVKPLTLMRWLVRLVTPPGGTVLDPFAGSGTTLEAAMLEEFHCIGIERELDYLPLIRERFLRNLPQNLVTSPSESTKVEA